MSVQKFDVIIAGASFAGLAVASQLQEKKVLLIDHKEVGENQTSACGTLLYVVEALGLRESVLQVHHQIYLHTSNRTYEYKLAYPACTIDYEKFCQGLLAKAKNLEIRRANVLDFEAETIKTDQGNFSAPFLVDASGWQALLGKHLDPKLADKNNLSFGLETEIEHQEEGLHFYYEPKLLRDGYLWLFPAGNTSRFGLGSYTGETQLKEKLEEFLGRFNLKNRESTWWFYGHRTAQSGGRKRFFGGGCCGAMSAVNLRRYSTFNFFWHKTWTNYSSCFRKRNYFF